MTSLPPPDAPSGLLHDRRPRPAAGFSMVEAIIALAITCMAVTATVGSWIFISRGERLNSTQVNLDLQVRKAMELLKRDLRKSSMDKVILYPLTPGPSGYSAISFPIARDNDEDGLVEMLNPTNIVWDTTVIYHVWTGLPYRLLRTTFDPRDNSMTDAQRVEQIASVVLYGHGRNTYGANATRTETIFENVFDWSVSGKGASFDAYAPTLGKQNFTFGSILLAPGAHTFKFSVVGKNAASSGYRIGIDTLTVSPCGAEREAEAQLPAIDKSGTTPDREYMAGGSWSGNHQLIFPATAVGHYFTLSMANDRWEETNFRGLGVLGEKAKVVWNDGSSPKDFEVQLEAPDPGYPNYSVQWNAASQVATNTSSPTYPFDIASAVTDGSLTNRACRILIRGRQMPGGTTLTSSGRPYYMLFRGPPTGFIEIGDLYLAEAASHSNLTPNASSSTFQLRRLYYDSGTGSSAWVPAGQFVSLSSNDYCYACFLSSSGQWLPYQIEKEKSYQLSFRINQGGNSYVWTGTQAGIPITYCIDNPSPGDTSAGDWSTKPVYTDNRLIGFYMMYGYCVSNGTFTSQIFDTGKAAPSYSNLTWSAYTPGGTSVRMRLRTGNMSDMSDAPSWSNVTAMAGVGSISPSSKRYAQFQAELNVSPGYFYGPSLKDVTLSWPGDTKITDISGVFTTGPNYGSYELTVDGKPLLKGLKISLSIFDDVEGWLATPKRMTSSMTSEIEPRNTGK